jgi:hypothetical protein
VEKGREMKDVYVELEGRSKSIIGGIENRMKKRNR